MCVTNQCQIALSAQMVILANIQMMHMLLRTYEQELQWLRHCDGQEKIAIREIKL